MPGPKKIILTNPHGFCAGVDRAIRMMDIALEKYGTPLFCLNEIVHNSVVVRGFEARGVVFVKNLESVPAGGRVVFSAHGVAPEVRAVADRRGLQVIDATCPFVEKIHAEIRRWSAMGLQIFLIGHRMHEEIIGIAGESPDNVTVIENCQEAADAVIDHSRGAAVATQTTLSYDEAESIIKVLEGRCPGIIRPPAGDICYATLNRQKAVRALAGQVDAVIVIGSKKSSNTNRLAEVAKTGTSKVFLVEEAVSVNAIDIHDAAVVGITAGASTPEHTTESVIEALGRLGFGICEKVDVIKENVRLKLPPI